MSRSVKAANGGNVPHLQAIIASHTVCTSKMMYCTSHAAALQQFWIYNLFDDCWFTKHCTISVFKMSRPTDFQKLYKHFDILQFMKSLRGAHFLHLACQAGGARPYPSVSYATGGLPSRLAKCPGILLQWNFQNELQPDDALLWNNSAQWPFVKLGAYCCIIFPLSSMELLQLEAILYALGRQDNFQLVLSHFVLKVS